MKPERRLFAARSPHLILAIKRRMISPVSDSSPGATLESRYRNDADKYGLPTRNSQRICGGEIEKAGLWRDKMAEQRK